MLTCREMTERTSAFVDGELGGMDWLRFRLHLAMCRHCPNFVEQIRRTRSLVRSALDAGRRAGADAMLIGAFRANYGTGARPNADSSFRRPCPPHNGN